MSRLKVPLRHEITGKIIWTEIRIALLMMAVVIVCLGLAILGMVKL
jgi:hypothetical protein